MYIDIEPKTMRNPKTKMIILVRSIFSGCDSIGSGTIIDKGNTNHYNGEESNDFTLDTFEDYTLPDQPLNYRLMRSVHGMIILATENCDNFNLLEGHIVKSNGKHPIGLYNTEWEATDFIDYNLENT